MSVGRIETESDLRAFVQRTIDSSPLATVVRQMQGPVSWGTGAPTDPPKAPRAIHIRLDGGANTTLYVWEGSSWVAK